MSEKEMSFWDHLEEFRGTLFRIIGILTAFTVVALIFMPKIFDTAILGPSSSNFITYRFFENASKYIPFLPDFSADKFNVEILNITMTSQFTTYLSSSFAFAFLIALPFLIYQLWMFIRPALYKNEIRSARTAFGFGGFMFYLGCAVGYFIVFPLIFRFLITFELSANIENKLSLDSYMKNFYTLILIMGIVFEMPLVFWLLSNLGLIYRSFFKKFRRHAIVACVILAALITPSGDPFSLVVVTIPLYFLWELSALMVKKDPEEEEDNDDLPTVVES